MVIVSDEWPVVWLEGWGEGWWGWGSELGLGYGCGWLFVKLYSLVVLFVVVARCRLPDIGTGPTGVLVVSPAVYAPVEGSCALLCSVVVQAALQAPDNTYGVFVFRVMAGWAHDESGDGVIAVEGVGFVVLCCVCLEMDEFVNWCFGLEGKVEDRFVCELGIDVLYGWSFFC